LQSAFFVGREAALLLEAIHHSTEAQVVGAQFDADAVASNDANAVALHAARESGAYLRTAVVAGEIALMSPEPDAAKAEAYFEHALSVSRHQQAKSWELRAAMSLARVWRDQGKVREARELLAPVYGWFTEGRDTRDLKDAKALLEELAM
jgi:predicted ATPase